MTPYREQPPAEQGLPPQTLECVIASGERHGWFVSVAIKMFVATWVAILGYIVNPLVPIVVAALALAWIVMDLRRHRGTHLVIRTEGERIHFGDPIGLDVTFRKLLDVRLDTKTTSKALNQPRGDGLNSIFGPIIPSGRSIQVDQSRIELVVKGRDEPVLVNREYISSTLAHENIRAIKVFLRKSGWLPADERPLEDRPKKKKKK